MFPNDRLPPENENGQQQRRNSFQQIHGDAVDEMDWEGLMDDDILDGEILDASPPTAATPVCHQQSGGGIRRSYSAFAAASRNNALGWISGEPKRPSLPTFHEDDEDDSNEHFLSKLCSLDTALDLSDVSNEYHFDLGGVEDVEQNIQGDRPLPPSQNTRSLSCICIDIIFNLALVCFVTFLGTASTCDSLKTFLPSSVASSLGLDRHPPRSFSFRVMDSQDHDVEVGNGKYPKLSSWYSLSTQGNRTLLTMEVTEDSAGIASKGGLGLASVAGDGDSLLEEAADAPTRSTKLAVEQNLHTSSVSEPEDERDTITTRDAEALSLLENALTHSRELETAMGDPRYNSNPSAEQPEEIHTSPAPKDEYDAATKDPSAEQPEEIHTSPAPKDEYDAATATTKDPSVEQPEEIHTSRAPMDEYGVATTTTKYAKALSISLQEMIDEQLKLEAEMHAQKLKENPLTSREPRDEHVTTAVLEDIKTTSLPKEVAAYSVELDTVTENHSHESNPSAGHREQDLETSRESRDEHEVTTTNDSKPISLAEDGTTHSTEIEADTEDSLYGSYPSSEWEQNLHTPHEPDDEHGATTNVVKALPTQTLLEEERQLEAELLDYELELSRSSREIRYNHKEELHYQSEILRLEMLLEDMEMDGELPPIFDLGLGADNEETEL